ncbi:MAG: cysteine desulfurase [Acidimicrobiales bacterium]|jgi:cysteine desulfurase
MKFLRTKKKRIYLDYAAATPLRSEVALVMRSYERDMFANASAIHQEGVAVRNAIERAREKLARTLKIRPKGVVFTGNGTESNNLAILGTVQERCESGVAYSDMEVISTRIEHPSVSKVLAHLATLGVAIKYMEVAEDGLIIPQSLQNTLSAKTVLVSFAYANSEIGVVQEVGKLARIVRAFSKAHDTYVVIHTDAAQAPLWLPCQLDGLLVDILTLDAGKCYGPKGVGILAMRHGVKLSSISYGGPQEGGLRPSTENTAGIIGAVHAIILAQQGREKRMNKVSILRDRMIELLIAIDGVVLNGSAEQRIANNINISAPGIDSEFAVISLDQAGIACSTKSACSGASGDGSAVVQAITNDTDRATSTIRFSLGEETTTRDICKAVEVLKSHIQKIRESHKQLTMT